VRWELKDEHKATWRTNGLHDLSYRVTRCVPLEVAPGGGGGPPWFACKVTVDCMLNGGHWSDSRVDVATV
jgi:hypothetical protein